MAVAMISAAIVFSASVVLAWTAYEDRLDFEHNFIIPNFMVDLDENPSVVVDKVINLTTTFPISDEGGPVNYYDSYIFGVSNIGTMDAMLKLEFSFKDYRGAISDANLDPGTETSPKLSSQLRYSIRYSYTTANLLDASWYVIALGEEDAPITAGFVNSEAEGNVSLNAVLRDILILDSSYTPAGLLSAVVNGDVTKHKDIFFEVKVWLGKQATLESASGKTTVMKMTMTAQQTIGNPKWE